MPKQYFHSCKIRTAELHPSASLPMHQNDGKYNRRQERLYQSPKGTQNRLFVPGNKIPLDKHKNQITIFPQFPEVNIKPTIPGCDRCLKFQFFRHTIPLFYFRYHSAVSFRPVSIITAGEYPSFSFALAMSAKECGMSPLRFSP